MSQKDSKLEVFLDKTLVHDNNNWWKNKFITHQNESGDYNDYYDETSTDHKTSENLICKELINNPHNNELTDEEVSIMNFSQDFENSESLFIHPMTNRYHANILFNGLIDKDIHHIEKDIVKTRTIYPDMRQSFYEFCQKFTSNVNVSN